MNTRYNSLLFGFMGLMAFMNPLSSCGSSKSKTHAEVVESDSAAALLATDSVVFREDIDSVCECTIVVDSPRGDDSLAAGVDAFIASTLWQHYMPVCDGASKTVYKKYAGNVGDGKAVVDYYGKGTMAYMNAQMADLRKAGMTGGVGLACDISIRKTYDTPRYATYHVDIYKFLGGAHGSTFDYSVNIAKPSGEVIAETVDSLKLKALQPLLRKGVLSYLNEGGGYSSKVTDSELNDCLFVENGIIPLPAYAPSLGKDGVRFAYQQYEIGPYALGLVVFTVPYSDIKPYLTKKALECIAE